MIDLNRIRSKVVAAMVASLLAVGTMPGVASGQGKKVGSDFIPVDGMVAGVVNPAGTLASPVLEMLPVEIADAWCLENIGVPLKQVESIKVIIAAPGPEDAMFAALVKFSQDVSVQDLNTQFVGDPVEVDGHACFEFVGPPGVVLHQLGSKEIVMASRSYLDRVIESRGKPTGPLAKFAAVVPHDGNLTILFAVEPIRPVITGLLQSQMAMIPPPFVPFTEIPELLDAVLLKVDIEDQQEGLKLVMLARDEDAAVQLEKIIVDGIEMARNLILAQILNEMQGDQSVDEAMRQYIQRMADMVVQTVTPKREGKRVTISAPAMTGMPGPLLSLGLLMPAVQSAGIATGRAQSLNNLKLLGLAMHNYHSAFRELPSAIHSDDTGKPLLSWRVMILPFI
ncbi:MAG: DUF1559 domain-containing protein, partial [Pirellulales bacterium]|nr:DUF1559 domain-containing protein [Pirellulales bacterium]